MWKVHRCSLSCPTTSKDQIWLDRGLGGVGLARVPRPNKCVKQYLFGLVLKALGNLFAYVWGLRSGLLFDFSCGLAIVTVELQVGLNDWSRAGKMQV